MKNNIYVCRVCGNLQGDPPWGEDGDTPSFNICVAVQLLLDIKISLLKALSNIAQNG